MSDYGATHEEEIDSLNYVIEGLVEQRNSLQAEIARLTPQATRDLPQVEGWYRYTPDDEIVKGGVVLVSHNACRFIVRKVGDHEYWWLDEMPPGWWSRDPIPAMEIPKEVE